ncbi:hypothetical protein GCM10008955_25460 [Deinococcus malanensis]|uniref:Lipoprotein n=1 Tax=Deinococcus malanensis TaxID=1706855 RepID=A0ABQ2EXQ6_9DEIO|nr:hypothetical protein [Deinococcus malanensis]GGK30582.1 hypothetical protein GCM10008955_25460 [Deinococcus malanensis]
MKAVRAVLAGALALGLNSCGGQETPAAGRPLTVVSVGVPAAVSATGPLTVTLRYVVQCGESDLAIKPIRRTATVLQLSASARYTPMVCAAVYEERELSYTDPGTPARREPFQISVNGKDWATVQVP